MNFTQFYEQFMQQYTCNARPCKSVDHLFNPKQNPEESLHKIIINLQLGWFMLKEMTQKQRLWPFRKTLLLGNPLLRSLVKSGIGTIKELLEIANRYANMEEDLSRADHKRKIS